MTLGLATKVRRAAVDSPTPLPCSWSVRQRIRTTLSGRVLPHCALNEVYVAEKDPSR